MTYASFHFGDRYPQRMGEYSMPGDEGVKQGMISYRLSPSTTG
jgi:hypothetical protein